MIVVAGIPRSGTTYMARALAGMEPGGTFPRGGSNGVYKTHLPPWSVPGEIDRAVFMFGDVADSVISTRLRRWDRKHFKNCGHEDLPATADIYERDVLGYEDIFDAWYQPQSFPLICARYEALGIGALEVIADFLGQRVKWPEWDRRPHYHHPKRREIESAYRGLVAKVREASDLKMFRPPTSILNSS